MKNEVSEQLTSPLAALPPDPATCPQLLDLISEPQSKLPKGKFWQPEDLANPLINSCSSQLPEN